MSEEDGFEHIREAFEKMFQGAFDHDHEHERENRPIPEMMGACSCCFRDQELGHLMLLYFPDTQERIKVFICTPCQFSCAVEDVCSFDNFKETLARYDFTDKTKQPSEN